MRHSAGAAAGTPLARASGSSRACGRLRRHPRHSRRGRRWHRGVVAGPPGFRRAMIRVLIADDHPVVRAGLRRIAEEDKDIIVTAEASNGEEALTAMRSAIVDIVLLDISMPGVPFIDTLKRLREDHPTVRVLVLSAHPEDQWAVRALRAGASGYLTKDHSPDQLVEA